MNINKTIGSSEGIMAFYNIEHVYVYVKIIISRAYWFKEFSYS